MLKLIQTMSLLATVVATGGEERTALKQTSEPPMESYNVVWDSQSKSSTDSMPLAGGNLGLNVWVENNDLLLLIGSPNCMDERGMQVKLGLVRLHFDQPVFDKNFRQELRLQESEIIVSGSSPSGGKVEVKLWCEVNRPVIHVDMNSGEPRTLTTSYETWSGYQASQQEGGFEWVKRLAEVNPRRTQDMKSQGMEDFAKSIPDPLSKLTLGGRLDAPGLIALPESKGKFNTLDTQITSVATKTPVSAINLTFTLRMEQDDSLTAWKSALAASAAQVKASTSESRAATLDWWKSFWNRSHISIAADPSKDRTQDLPWLTGRNYQLVRYTMAANTSGRAMTLFNGGIFACAGNPDKRNWDFCQFMAQNQRLVYWPMLRAGDFDLLKVATDFYQERTEMNRMHVRKFWDVEGVTYPEALNIFGLSAIGTDGDGRCKPKHLLYHYTSGMEFALMMLEMERYTGKAIDGYVEPALGFISYYDEYFQKSTLKRTGKPLDEKGRLIIYPSDACEPYHGCTNNTDVIAGLTALSRELLALPQGRLTAKQRTYVEGFRARIPEFPMEEKDGKKFFGAARSWEWVMKNGNMDFPQMYVCFPFSILSLGRSDMSLAQNTWDLSPIEPAIQHQNQCWYQSAINLARMGQAAQAAALTVEKFNHPGYRFPTFYFTRYSGGKGNFCHSPDMDHGGTAMTALQEMLMQADGKRILLGPAWPKNWNCSFKLCAPYQTTVTGHVTGGKVIVDSVSPESRRADIQIFPLAAETSAVTVTADAPVLLSSPQDYQVFQRESKDAGKIEIAGSVKSAGTWEYRLTGNSRVGELPGNWQPLPINATTRSFATKAAVPAGGWYKLEVRSEGKSTVVERVGVGEVFVVAGQSNSANHGSGKQQPKSGLVSAFDGQRWVLANDPQPGASGGGGSFLPAFGDALVAKYQVPVALAATGVGSSSVREWLPQGEKMRQQPTTGKNVVPAGPGEWTSMGVLFDKFVKRCQALGPRGFRAVLWHQGESDAGQARAGYPADRQITGEQYRQFMEILIKATRKQAGWEMPWFVALATFHSEKDAADEEFRAAQKALWDNGIAVEGPDSDALKGNLRAGVHFNGEGLQKHGEAWAQKVGLWLDKQLSK